MIKNRTTQIVFQTVFCVLGVIGIMASLGYFEAQFKPNFYVWYTNLSNYICIGFMFVSLAKTIKLANKKEDGLITLAPTFKFLCVIMILVTCLVYNVLLAKDSVKPYFLTVSNLTLHLILPIMFVLDWVLFYPHGKTKWYYPLLSVVMPFIYVVFVLIRAAIIGSRPVSLLYPYFFLDVKTLGWAGFLGWVVALIVVFVALGYLIYALDNIKRWRTKSK